MPGLQKNNNDDQEDSNLKRATTFSSKNNKRSEASVVDLNKKQKHNDKQEKSYPRGTTSSATNNNRLEASVGSNNDESNNRLADINGKYLKSASKMTDKELRRAQKAVRRVQQQLIDNNNGNSISVHHETNNINTNKVKEIERNARLPINKQKYDDQEEPDQKRTTSFTSTTNNRSDTSIIGSNEKQKYNI